MGSFWTLKNIFLTTILYGICSLWQSRPIHLKCFFNNIIASSTYQLVHLNVACILVDHDIVSPNHLKTQPDTDLSSSTYFSKDSLSRLPSHLPNVQLILKLAIKDITARYWNEPKFSKRCKFCTASLNDFYKFKWKFYRPTIPQSKLSWCRTSGK